jgi:hypothetical protein
VLDIPLLLVVAPLVKAVVILFLFLPALFVAEEEVNQPPEEQFIAAALAAHLQVTAEEMAAAEVAWLLVGLHLLGQPEEAEQADTPAMAAGAVKTTLLLALVVAAEVGAAVLQPQMDHPVLVVALAALVC